MKKRILSVAQIVGATRSACATMARTTTAAALCSAVFLTMPSCGDDKKEDPTEETTEERGGLSENTLSVSGISAANENVKPDSVRLMVGDVVLARAIYDKTNNSFTLNLPSEEKMASMPTETINGATYVSTDIEGFTNGERVRGLEYSSGDVNAQLVWSTANKWQWLYWTREGDSRRYVDKPSGTFTYSW